MKVKCHHFFIEKVDQHTQTWFQYLLNYTCPPFFICNISWILYMQAYNHKSHGNSFYTMFEPCLFYIGGRLKTVFSMKTLISEWRPGRQTPSSHKAIHKPTKAMSEINEKDLRFWPQRLRKTKHTRFRVWSHRPYFFCLFFFFCYLFVFYFEKI